MTHPLGWDRPYRRLRVRAHCQSIKQLPTLGCCMGEADMTGGEAKVSRGMYQSGLPCPSPLRFLDVCPLTVSLGCVGLTGPARTLSRRHSVVHYPTIIGIVGSSSVAYLYRCGLLASLAEALQENRSAAIPQCWAGVAHPVLSRLTAMWQANYTILPIRRRHFLI